MDRGTKRDILVVEDEDDIRELIRHNLARNGYGVTAAGDGETALQIAVRRPPSLILLDLMLPDINGLEVCRVLRQDPKTAAVPIIIVTARGEESDVVAGLETGADDYVTKPFNMNVLLARVRAALRRRGAPPPDRDAVVHAGDVVVDPVRHEVLVRGRPVEMTFSELRILHLLAGRPGRVFTREQIVDGVRGADYPVTDRAVDVQIVGIRKKLGAQAELVETVRGVGYRFRE